MTIDKDKMRKQYNGQKWLCSLTRPNPASKTGVGRTDKNGNQIEFRLSFEEWAGIWLLSGHYNDRGCKSGQYVMTRINDIDHYEVGNVRIATTTENLIEASGPDRYRGKMARKNLEDLSENSGYFKTHPAFYKAADVRTIYANTHKRHVLKGKNGDWMYVKQGFKDRFIKGKKKECWDWKGAYHRQGMGLFTIQRTDGRKNGNITARRLALAIRLGRALEHEEFVYNTCGNPCCVNPHHMRIGTQDDVKAFSANHKRKNGKHFGRQFYIDNKEFILTNPPLVIAEKFALTHMQAANVKISVKRLIKMGKLTALNT